MLRYVDPVKLGKLVWSQFEFWMTFRRAELNTHLNVKFHQDISSVPVQRRDSGAKIRLRLFVLRPIHTNIATGRDQPCVWLAIYLWLLPVRSR